MAQPLLEITAAGTPAQVTPHLLPCRIHHTGPVAAAASFWEPREKDGQKIAYFRGRKLHGQAVRLPAGYRGVVAERRASPRETARAAAAHAPEAASAAAAAAAVVIDVDASPAEQRAAELRHDTGSLAVRAAFDEVVVWGHQATADAATDPYVRGLEEWLALSEKIHGYE